MTSSASPASICANWPPIRLRPVSSLLSGRSIFCAESKKRSETVQTCDKSCTWAVLQAAVRLAELSYHGGIADGLRRRKVFVSVLPGFGLKSCDESRIALRALGWASVAVGVAALGLYVGRELLQRYKFKRRTPATSTRTPATRVKRLNSAWASRHRDQDS